MTVIETTRRTFIAGLAASCMSLICGSTPASAQRGRDETVQAFLDRVANYPAVPVTRWHNEGAWGANLGPALRAAVDAIKSGQVPAGKVSIPYRPGGWELASEAVLDASWAVYLIEGDIRLTATRVQHGLYVTTDRSAGTHRLFLQNVAIIGNGKVIIDGNADKMNFAEPVPGADGSAYAALRCVRVKGLYVKGVHVTNGPMDSMSVKQCPGHLIEDVEFSRSRYDNGFSATTDLDGYSEADPATWGGGILRRFKAHHNNDFGATSYNCSGQSILDGESWSNRGGISYECRFHLTDGSKNYHGTIDAVSCHDNHVRGIYVDGSGVKVGDRVRTWNNGGTDQDDPHGLTGFGVVVSNVHEVYVGGDHSRNEKGGVLLTNGSGNPMVVTLAAKCNDNGLVGCYARSLKQLDIRPGAEFNGNGYGYHPEGARRVSFTGYGLLAVTNDRGERKMYKKGSVLIDSAQFSSNSYRAIQVEGYDSVVLRHVWGSNNFASKGMAAGAAVKLENISSAYIEGLVLENSNGRQEAVLEIGRGVGAMRYKDMRGAATRSVILDRRGT